MKLNLALIVLLAEYALTRHAVEFNQKKIMYVLWGLYPLYNITFK